MGRWKDILRLAALLRNTSSVLAAVVLSRSNKQLPPNQHSHMSLLSFLYICTKYQLDSPWIIVAKAVFCFIVFVLHRTWLSTTSSILWRRVSAVLTPLCSFPIGNCPMETCPRPLPRLAVVSLPQKHPLSLPETVWQREMLPVQIRSWSGYSWK